MKKKFGETTADILDPPRAGAVIASTTSPLRAGPDVPEGGPVDHRLLLPVEAPDGVEEAAGGRKLTRLLVALMKCLMSSSGNSLKASLKLLPTRRPLAAC